MSKPLAGRCGRCGRPMTSPTALEITAALALGRQDLIWLKGHRYDVVDGQGPVLVKVRCYNHIDDQFDPRSKDNPMAEVYLASDYTRFNT